MNSKKADIYAVQLSLSSSAYILKFRHAFGIAHGTRNTTDTLLVKATLNGVTGYGEAALPPYLGYDVKVLCNSFGEYFSDLPSGMDGIQTVLRMIINSNLSIPSPIRCATDIAIHDLCGRLTGMPVRKLLEIPDAKDVRCSFTLGISSVDEMLEKIKETEGFTLFKHKLGGDNDRERILAFKKATNASFCVDANQGWHSIKEAATEINFLTEQGCLFVEQPLPVAMNKQLNELRDKIKLPIILDESIQRLSDLMDLAPYCDGINIKLVKCGGLASAKELMRIAKRSGKKVLIGCMSESSCGAAAASELSGWADWVDLDGPLLIDNDPFSGVSYKNGMIVQHETPGLGIDPIAVI